MKILLSAGQVVDLPVVRPSDGRNLAQWLADHGHPLNTRCGGRGICRGCEVVSIPEGRSQSRIKACQVPASAGGTELRIPAASCADQSLTGVSVFDLHLPSGASPRCHHGLTVSIDVGTTTLAAALWDGPTVRCLATMTAPNPQRRFGDDVLSRIGFSLENETGPEQLQRCLVEEGLNPLIVALLDVCGSSPDAIDAVICSGNPAMLQSLTGDSLAGLARYPFHLAWDGRRRVSAADLGFLVSCSLELLPALGPFVGSDVLAGALACGMIEDGRPSLLIDYGTNGELMLYRDGKVWATATAAGPAFEGGRLACGTTATPNAISALSLKNGRWQCLGGRGRLLLPGRGITGAAYIDFLAVGVESRLLSAAGRINRQHPLWKRHGMIEDGIARIRIDERNWISEADVAELLQAKAATGAGIAVLLEAAGTAPAELARVLVAGGFGYHLRPGHACRIGLLPPVSTDRIVLVGNASLAGASLALQYDLSDSIGALREACNLIELNQVSTFSDHYLNALGLHPMETA